MRFHTHSSGLRTSRQVERKILNNVIFTKLKVDTSGIIDDELVEPFDALVSAGRHYIHHGALPPTRQSAHRPDSAPSSPRRDHGQPPDHTTVLSGRSSSKTTYVPPAGFEPALPPPEGGALSPELRGPRRTSVSLPHRRHAGGGSGAAPRSASMAVIVTTSAFCAVSIFEARLRSCGTCARSAACSIIPVPP